MGQRLQAALFLLLLILFVQKYTERRAERAEAAKSEAEKPLFRVSF
jgi:hypothetical protein